MLSIRLPIVYDSVYDSVVPLAREAKELARGSMVYLAQWLNEKCKYGDLELWSRGSGLLPLLLGLGLPKFLGVP